MMFLDSAIDAHLYEQVNASRRDVAGRKRWRASLIGSCLRAQYLTEQGVAGLPIDARTARIFEVGHLTGRMVEGWFKDMGILLGAEVPFADDDLNLGAHADFIVKHEGSIVGLELKSKSSKSFWWAAKKNETVAGHNQLLQAAACALLAERADYHVDYWQVMSISKDDLSIQLDDVTGAHMQEVIERCAQLNAATSHLDLPCDCFEVFGGKGWKWCKFGIDESTCCDPEAMGRVA